MQNPWTGRDARDAIHEVNTSRIPAVRAELTIEIVQRRLNSTEAVLRIRVGKADSMGPASDDPEPQA